MSSMHNSVANVRHVLRAGLSTTTTINVTTSPAACEKRGRSRTPVGYTLLDRAGDGPSLRDVTAAADLREPAAAAVY